MKGLETFLVETILGEAAQIDKVVVVYSGRFQPFHKGHYATYDNLIKKFGKDSVYIGTSDVTDTKKSPFGFKEKKAIMMKMFGIQSNKIVNVKNPYAPQEILSKFDSDTTGFITVVGEKDSSRLSGKYFTPYKGKVEQGYLDKGYVYASPAQPNAISGTDVRYWLSSGSETERKKNFTKAYPKFDEQIFKLITLKLKGLKECINEEIKMNVNVGDTLLMGKFKNKKVVVKSIGKDEWGMPTINGKKAVTFRIPKKELKEGATTSFGMGTGDEPDTSFSADGQPRILNKARPEPWYKQGGYTQMDIPKADAMRGRGKSKDTETQFRKGYYKLKNVVQSTLNPADDPHTTEDWQEIESATAINKPKRFWEIPKNQKDTIISKEDINEMMNSLEEEMMSEMGLGGGAGVGLSLPGGYINGAPNPKDVKKIKSKLDGDDNDEYTKVKEAFNTKDSKIDANFMKHHKTSMAAPNMGHGAEEDTYDFDDLGNKKAGYQTDTKDTQNRGYEPVKEAQAVSGGKVHKFITGKNLGFKGKKYPQIEFETIGVDNKNGTIRVKIIAPKEIFGNEMSLDFRSVRRGPYFKTDTSKVNESIVNDIFLKILLPVTVTGVTSATAYILRVVNGFIIDVLLSGISNYAKNVKNLVSPDSFTKFTTELSKSKEFNKQFLNILIKHGGLKNTNVVAFLNDVENTKEFNDILYKYYPKETNKFNTNERNKAVNEFRNAIRNTLKDKGGMLIKTIKNKFPELKNVQIEMAMADMDAVEKYADQQLAPSDIELGKETDHFFQRLNDPRNGKEVSPAELTGFFKRLAKNKKKFLEFVKKYKEFVVKDKRTNINIPFVVMANKLIAKTIMRKDDFKSITPIYVTEGLLNEGGAYGHMNHPFDIQMNLTFGDLKNIVTKALNGDLDLAREKTDGQALAISWVNGRLVAARNKSHLKNKGEGAMTIGQVAANFANRGALTDAYTFAMKDLSSAVSSLSEPQKKKIFKDGACFMNLEVIYPKNANVIPYGQNLLVFHGTFEYDESGEVIGENQQAASILAGMIKQVNKHVQSTYTIQGPPMLSLPKTEELTKKQGKYISMISKLQSEYKLSDSAGVADYHQAYWTDLVNKNAKSLDAQQKIGLVKRWAFGDKGFRIAEIQDAKIKAWADNMDKKDQTKISKENIMKFEEIFLGVGADVLAFAQSVLTANPSDATKKMRAELGSAIKSLKATGTASQLDKLKIELQRLNSLGGFDKIVPNEGLVFVYNGNTYKLTGAFAPLNQILGIFKFSR